MPAVNGILTPPPAAESNSIAASGTKRKRTDSESEPQLNGTNGFIHAPEASAPPAEREPEQTKELQSDMLTVLRR
jgi:hypothetical protein